MNCYSWRALTCRLQNIFFWVTDIRLAWWKLQISYMFWQHCSYKRYATMLPAWPTRHHSSILFSEEGVCLLSMNSSCVQHILELGENSWKLSNRDILTLAPYIHFPWRFPVMWILDDCWLWDCVFVYMFCACGIIFPYSRNKFHMLLTSSLIWL